MQAQLGAVSCGRAIGRVQARRMVVVVPPIGPTALHASSACDFCQVTLRSILPPTLFTQTMLPFHPPLRPLPRRPAVEDADDVVAPHWRTATPTTAVAATTTAFLAAEPALAALATIRRAAKLLLRLPLCLPLARSFQQGCRPWSTQPARPQRRHWLALLLANRHAHSQALLPWHKGV